MAKYLTTKEAAEYLGVSASYVQKLYLRGQLAFLRFGERRGVRFEKAALDSWVRNRRRPVGRPRKRTEPRAVQP